MTDCRFPPPWSVEALSNLICIKQRALRIRFYYARQGEF
jgi:hypothetical protein